MKLKSIIISLCFLGVVPAEVFSQITVPEPPFEDRSQFKFTQLDSGSTLTRNFYFNKTGGRSQYAGFNTLYVYTDSATTATQTVVTYDSLLVDAFALEYDEVSGQMEVCQTALCTDGKDSVNVASWINWGANHSDNKFTISKVLNLQLCDGVRVVAQAKSDVNLRFEHKQAKDNN